MGPIKNKTDLATYVRIEPNGRGQDGSSVRRSAIDVQTQVAVICATVKKFRSCTTERVETSWGWEDCSGKQTGSCQNLQQTNLPGGCQVVLQPRIHRGRAMCSALLERSLDGLRCKYFSPAADDYEYRTFPQSTIAESSSSSRRCSSICFRTNRSSGSDFARY